MTERNTYRFDMSLDHDFTVKHFVAMITLEHLLLGHSIVEIGMVDNLVLLNVHVAFALTEITLSSINAFVDQFPMSSHDIKLGKGFLTLITWVCSVFIVIDFFLGCFRLLDLMNLSLVSSKTDFSCICLATDITGMAWSWALTDIVR